ncbi:MAG: hypothetical protein ACOX4N_08270 [Dethiobacteraceae bacterium]
MVRSIWPFSWLLTKAATALPLSILLNVILFAYLLSAAGKQQDSEEIILNGWDRIPTELITAGCAAMFLLGILLTP